MGDTVIITEDKPQPEKPDMVVVVPAPPKEPEKIVTEKTTIVETRRE
jgi:hypothetical protein